MNLMVDSETLGVTPGSAILTIGACIFGNTIGQEFYQSVSLKSQMRYGFSIDSGTLDWWSKQNKKAQQAAFGRHKNERTIKTTLAGLSNFILLNGGKKLLIWGHGASADPVWLEEAFRRVGLPIPWDYWNIRDTRTLFDAAWGEGFYAKGKKEEAIALLGRSLTPHNSLDDALVSAQMVILAKSKLKVS